jgi:hypothetical protein
MAAIGILQRFRFELIRFFLTFPLFVFELPRDVPELFARVMLVKLNTDKTERAGKP